MTRNTSYKRIKDQHLNKLFLMHTHKHNVSDRNHFLSYNVQMFRRLLFFQIGNLPHKIHRYDHLFQLFCKQMHQFLRLLRHILMVMDSNNRIHTIFHMYQFHVLDYKNQQDNQVYDQQHNQIYTKRFEPIDVLLQLYKYLI